MNRPAALVSSWDRAPDASGGPAIADRVERAIEAAVARVDRVSSPPRLREAIVHSVFPGGGRLRPRLCLAVSAACGGARSDRAEAAAAAVELVHCASLVHDDLPCFDDAPLRRGRPSTHAAFGEPTALLVGDALIVLAFEILGRAGAHEEIVLLAQSAGAHRGVIAGQAWEGEAAIAIDEYHRAKTATLFEAAAGMGAMASGGDATAWRAFGEAVGRAYQAADDLVDATQSASAAGKTTGRDAALGRPSLVRSAGIEAARRRLVALMDAARESVPRCREAGAIEAWLASAERRMTE